jgi:hypothetical protein
VFLEHGVPHFHAMVIATLWRISDERSCPSLGDRWDGARRHRERGL